MTLSKLQDNKVLKIQQSIDEKNDRIKMLMKTNAESEKRYKVQKGVNQLYIRDLQKNKQEITRLSKENEELRNSIKNISGGAEIISRLSAKTEEPIEDIIDIAEDIIGKMIEEEYQRSKKENNL